MYIQKLKENARQLQIRPDDFESILINIGFGPAQHSGTTGKGGTHRYLSSCSYSATSQSVELQAFGVQWIYTPNFEIQCTSALSPSPECSSTNVPTLCLVGGLGTHIW